ncbi:DEAD/DEAH box helicase [Aeromonas simiae]|uniref:DEAD/DEAH box helicase n=1 Tax=Aeromonas simiae TaxID=218936 RepID=UPI00266BBE25|nr:DEAD/DEAH box helicase [Aeromonas simiae]MDO2947703.1 DEAD/DEAH box helicase [Aeromonas simiae]MDO2952323.1 DEAD/DEAH box helicase [Aeromonas simiae]MDO2954918.1 DEAD/DEAH box helicase [Aeromonas simiae]
MTFRDLGLSPHLLRAIEELGYTSPTPIQQEAIPAVLAGKDVLGGARTGTGKTAGFALPMLNNLLLNHGRGRRQVRALILAPTRELAAQVGKQVDDYARHLPLRVLTVYGGVIIKPDIEAIKKGVDVLVATPGRVLDLLSQKALTFERLEVLVLDEADRMLDMGFIRDIERILRTLPSERQSLLFSATFNDEIKALAGELLHDPVLIEVDPANTTADKVRQRVIRVDRERKRELLAHLIQSEQWQQALIFARTRHIADRLAKQLERDGLEATAIHGEKSQAVRNAAMEAFRRGELRILVATDIAARGLDIDQLEHVVNFEPPQSPEDYVHRIGRTGRAGRGGEAISLICSEELGQLQQIERFLGESLETEQVPGFEPSGKPTRQTLPGSKPVQNPPRKGKKPAAKPAKTAKPAATARRDKDADEVGFMPVRRQARVRIEESDD